MGGALALAGCTEPVGSGRFVSIPTVRVACTSARCLGATTGTAYLTLTTSGCSSPGFGETATGSVSVSCNGVTGCTGTITSFSNSNGSATSIAEGFYSACISIDFNSNWTGTAITGDSTGSQNNVQIVSGVSQVTVSSYTDL